MSDKWETGDVSDGREGEGKITDGKRVNTLVTKRGNIDKAVLISELEHIVNRLKVNTANLMEASIHEELSRTVVGMGGTFETEFVVKIHFRMLNE